MNIPQSLKRNKSFASFIGYYPAAKQYIDAAASVINDDDQFKKIVLVALSRVRSEINASSLRHDSDRFKMFISFVDEGILRYLNEINDKQKGDVCLEKVVSG